MRLARPKRRPRRTSRLCVEGPIESTTPDHGRQVDSAAFITEYNQWFEINYGRTYILLAKYEMYVHITYLLRASRLLDQGQGP
jgi:hypothetical protein